MNKSDFFNDDKSFRAIYEAAVEGIMAIDNKGKIMMANKASMNMFGYDQIELLGKSINSLVPRKLRQNHRDYMNTYFEKPGSRKMGIGRDLLGMKNDGTEFPIEVSLSHTMIDKGLVSIAFCVLLSKS